MFTLKELFGYTPPVPQAFWYWGAAIIFFSALTVYFYKTAKGGKKK